MMDTSTTLLEPDQGLLLPPNANASSVLHEVDDKGFGPHLMLDCQQCNYEKISSVDYVSRVLDELPTAIGMTKIIPPYVFPYSGLVPEDRGVTGMVIIAESHLTFHSFVEKDYFFFDIFSCKYFDVQPAIDYIVKAFEVGYYEKFHVMRGRHFPRTPHPARR